MKYSDAFMFAAVVVLAISPAHAATIISATVPIPQTMPQATTNTSYYIEHDCRFDYTLLIPDGIGIETLGPYHYFTMVRAIKKGFALRSWHRDS